MKAFRLYNLTELGPASPLHFLEKSGAEGYRDYVRWPYLNSGRYPLSIGGTVPLEDLDLRTEQVDLNAVVIPELELVLLERDGIIGTCHILSGQCFDPDAWEPANISELANPQAGPLIEAAQQRLRGGGTTH
jgi:hypothetical protein